MNRSIRMEKKGLVSNSLKDRAGIVTRAIRSSKTTYEEEDYNIVGFSWPPRSYKCSFCKREFRSAQDLGGHMNVHRKDRARLKGSPPRDSQYTSTILNLNLNKVPINPNPNFSSTSSASSPSSRSSWISPISSTLPSLISPPAPPPFFSVPSSENMKWGTLFNHPLNFKASDFGTTVKKVE